MFELAVLVAAFSVAVALDSANSSNDSFVESTFSLLSSAPFTLTFPEAVEPLYSSNSFCTSF